MEDEVERLGSGGQAQLFRGDLLSIGEHPRLELDVAWLVDAMHVAERRRKEVTRPGVTGAERLDGLQEIVVGGVELVVDLSFDAVFFAADYTDLDFEDYASICSLGEQLLGDLEVLSNRHCGSIPHMRLKQRVAACVHTLLRDGEQRPDVGIQLLLGAVVGVQRNGDVVLCSDDVGEFGERYRPGDHVFDTEPGTELGPTGRKLDDAIASRVGESFYCSVDGLGTNAVDGWKGELVFLGPAKHLGVDLGSCDRHGVIPPCEESVCPDQYGKPNASCRLDPQTPLLHEHDETDMALRRFSTPAVQVVLVSAGSVCAVSLLAASESVTTNLALLPGFLDPVNLLNSFGTWVLVGLLLVVFIESGLLFPLLPGDSLLFTAGLIAASKSTDIEPFASIWLLVILIPIAAVLGDQVGFLIGTRGGAALFKSNDAKFFKKKYIDESHAFFVKHGPITIILARFVPIVRTFAPVVAGASKMKYSLFFTYNVVGGILWGSGVTMLGYLLGQIDFIREHVDIIFVIIVLVSVLPIVFEVGKRMLKARKTPLSEANDAIDAQQDPSS